MTKPPNQDPPAAAPSGDSSNRQRPLHQARLTEWASDELARHLATITAALAERGDCVPLRVALELLGGELEAFVLFGRLGHLDPPRPDEGIPIALLQRKSSNDDVNDAIRVAARDWSAAKLNAEAEVLRKSIEMLRRGVEEIMAVQVEGLIPAHPLQRLIDRVIVAPPELRAPVGTELGLTVGELREAMRDLPDAMTITVRASSLRDEWICGGITSAHVDTGCDEDEEGNNPEFFAIEVSDDEADFDDGARGGLTCCSSSS